MSTLTLVMLILTVALCGYEQAKAGRIGKLLLAQNLVPILEGCIPEYKSAFWLFEGIHGQCYSAASLQRI